MSLVKTSSITFETLDFSGLCKRLQANPSLILLDVRTKEEFANDHPPVEALGRFRGAMNININDLPERVNELAAYKDKEIIVYCSHSHRSPRASYYLSTHGFSKVSNVSIGVSYFSTQPVPSCLRDRFIQFPAPAR
jgi:rhodanese-related sulfurtransferase